MELVVDLSVQNAVDRMSRWESVLDVGGSGGEEVVSRSEEFSGDTPKQFKVEDQVADLMA